VAPLEMLGELLATALFQAFLLTRLATLSGLQVRAAALSTKRTPIIESTVKGT
jgi:hypothetical protein